MKATSSKPLFPSLLGVVQKEFRCSSERFTCCALKPFLTCPTMGAYERAERSHNEGGHHDCSNLSTMQSDSQESHLAAALEMRVLRVGVGDG